MLADAPIIMSSEPVNADAVRRICVRLMLFSAVAAATILWAWPSLALGADGAPTPQGVFLDPEATILLWSPTGFIEVEFQRDIQLLAFAGGVLGACIYAMSALGEHLGDGSFSMSWKRWYDFAPIIGGAIGLAAISALRSSAALVELSVQPVPSATWFDIPSSGAAATAVGIFAGISTKRAVRWLRHLATRIFRVEDDEGDFLQIEEVAVSRRPEEAILVIRGQGFSERTTFSADAKPLASTRYLNPRAVLAFPGTKDFDAKLFVAKNPSGDVATWERPAETQVEVGSTPAADPDAKPEPH